MEKRVWFNGDNRRRQPVANWSVLQPLLDPRLCYTFLRISMKKFTVFRPQANARGWDMPAKAKYDLGSSHKWCVRDIFQRSYQTVIIIHGNEARNLKSPSPTARWCWLFASTVRITRRRAVFLKILVWFARTPLWHNFVTDTRIKLKSERENTPCV